VAKEYYKNSECALSGILNIIGAKWRVPILWYLAEKPLRYNELKRCLHGVTNIMLTRSLREMEEANLIIRKEYEVVPPHVEYSLTERAQELIPALAMMNDLGKKWLTK